jgi:hypothetical protein
MAKVVQDESGQLFVDQGGGTLTPVTEEQALAFQSGKGALSGAGQAVAQGTENLITGAGSLLSDNPYWQQANKQGREVSDALNLANPVTSAAAQYAPQAAIGTGAALAAPAGLLGTAVVAGTEAALGAATTPESPIEGALVGGLLGAAGELAPAVGAKAWASTERPRNWIADKVGLRPGAVPEPATFNPGGLRPGERAEVAPGAPGANPEAMIPDPIEVAPSPSVNPPDFNADPGTPPPAPNPAPRMADRVAQSLDAADAAAHADAMSTTSGGLRSLEGTMTPGELFAHGIDISPAQAKLLTARANTPEGYRAHADLRKEQLLMSAATPEGEARRMLDYQQQQAATNYITRELDLPAGVFLTDHVLADTIQNVGSRMDDIAGEMGAMPLTQNVRDEFTDILRETTGSHRGQLDGFISEIEQKAANNGGFLTGDDWAEMRTKIGRMIEAGTRQGSIGKVSDAGALMDTMTDLMESGLPDASRAELETLRRQYAIASTLNKSGTRNPDGMINPVSFYQNWKRPQSKATRGQDPIGRFMNTMVTLTKKRVPDSGTAPRLLDNLKDVALDFVPGGSVIRRVIR